MIIPEKKKNEILEKIGIIVKLKAKELVPFDMGDLSRSINYRIEGNSVIIYSDLDYAKDMEYGKPPEPLSESEKAELTKWAERHKANPKGVINKIQTKGIEVGSVSNPLHITSFGRNSYRPFLRPALFQSLTDIKKIIKKELE